MATKQETRETWRAWLDLRMTELRAFAAEAAGDAGMATWTAEIERPLARQIAHPSLARVGKVATIGLQARGVQVEDHDSVRTERDALRLRLRELERAERGQKRREAAGEGWERAEALERELAEWRTRCLRLEAERDLLTRQTVKAEAELAEAAPWTDAPFWADEP